MFLFNPHKKGTHVAISTAYSVGKLDIQLLKTKNPFNDGVENRFIWYIHCLRTLIASIM